MRRLILSTLPALLFPIAGTGQTQSGMPQIHEEQIKVPSVEVRSGPGEKYPATMTLRRNALVLVRTRTTSTDEFLEIAPPQGSISWIPKAIVTKMGMPSNRRQNFVITGDPSDGPASVYPGGPSIADGPLMVDNYPGKVPARRGTQGTIIGDPVKPGWDDRLFYPILPLPGESRFIPRSAVYPDANNAIAHGTPSAGGSPATPPKDTRALFAQAQQADRAGNTQQAIELYEQVARESSISNDGLANYCATRVYELRRKTNATGTLTSRTNDARSTRSSPTPPAPPLPGAGGSSNAQSEAKPSNLRSTGAGYLRNAGFVINNRSTYALMDQSRRVTFYVTPEPGVTLEPYLDHWVDLTGLTEVRGDIGSAQYMRVVRIALIR